MKDTLIDSSALILVLNDSARRSSFELHAIQQDLRIIVPSAGLDELFATKDPAKLERTATELSGLLTILGSRFELAAPHIEIFRSEYKRRLTAVPLLSVVDRTKLLSLLRSSANQSASARVRMFQQVRHVVKRWKDTRTSDAKSIRARAHSFVTKAGLTPAGLKAGLTNYSASIVPEWLFDSQLRTSCGAPVGSAARILQQHDRCPALKTWVGLAHLAMFAEALPKNFAPGDPFFEMLTPNRNDFYDAALTSPAAYCDQFISKDEHLIGRCNLLHDCGWVSFKAVHLIQDLHI